MATIASRSRLQPSDYVYSHITKISDVCGGAATIDGGRVRVVDIVYLHKEGCGPEKMLEEYPTLNLARVHAALSYYYENPEEIEASFREDEEWDEWSEQQKADYLSRKASR